MHRLVVFADNEFEIPAILIRGTVEALARRNDMELAALCVPEKRTFAGAFFRSHLRRAVARTQSFFSPVARRRYPLAAPFYLNRWARRARVRILIPPEGNINHPEFIEHLRSDVQATIALSFFCIQKFSPDLLAVFGHAINYHNGLLPRYRGLKATAWSKYYDEQETGFTFHRMTARFDRGPILLQGALPVTPNQRAWDLDVGKATIAANEIPRVLQMAADGDPGKPQQGKSSYFSYKDLLNITKIPDPSILSLGELEHRLRAFECLRIRIGDRWRSVTAVQAIPEHGGRTGRFSFRTSDGVLLKPVRFQHLPYALHRTLKWFFRRLPRGLRP